MTIQRTVSKEERIEISLQYLDALQQMIDGLRKTVVDDKVPLYGRISVMPNIVDFSLDKAVSSFYADNMCLHEIKLDVDITNTLKAK